LASVVVGVVATVLEGTIKLGNFKLHKGRAGALGDVAHVLNGSYIAKYRIRSSID